MSVPTKLGFWDLLKSCVREETSLCDPFAITYGCKVRQIRFEWVSKLAALITTSGWKDDSVIYLIDVAYIGSWRPHGEDVNSGAKFYCMSGMHRALALQKVANDRLQKSLDPITFKVAIMKPVPKALILRFAYGLNNSHKNCLKNSYGDRLTMLLQQYMLFKDTEAGKLVHKKYNGTRLNEHADFLEDRGFVAHEFVHVHLVEAMGLEEKGVQAVEKDCRILLSLMHLPKSWPLFLRLANSEDENHGISRLGLLSASFLDAPDDLKFWMLERARLDKIGGSELPNRGRLRRCYFKAMKNLWSDVSDILNMIEKSPDLLSTTDDAGVFLKNYLLQTPLRLEDSASSWNQCGIKQRSNHPLLLALSKAPRSIVVNLRRDLYERLPRKAGYKKHTDRLAKTGPRFSDQPLSAASIVSIPEFSPNESGTRKRSRKGSFCRAKARKRPKLLTLGKEEETSEYQKDVSGENMENVPHLVIKQPHDSRFPALCPENSRIRAEMTKKDLNRVLSLMPETLPSQVEIGQMIGTLDSLGYAILPDAAQNMKEDIDSFLWYLGTKFGSYTTEETDKASFDLWSRIFNSETGKKIRAKEDRTPREKRCPYEDHRFQFSDDAVEKLKKTAPDRFAEKLRIDTFLVALLEQYSVLPNIVAYEIPYDGSRVLATLRPCKPQHPHCDYVTPDDNIGLDQEVQYFAMMSGRDGFNVIVWQGSHIILRDATIPKQYLDLLGCYPYKKIHVPPYSVAVFRGDVVHAGDGYLGKRTLRSGFISQTDVNLRFHVFLKLKKTILSNTTQKIYMRSMIW